AGFDPAGDVARRWIERLAGTEVGPALVVLDQGRDYRRFRNGGSFGLVAGDVEADRAVAPREIPSRHALHVLRRHFFEAVAVEEKEAPVALGAPVAEDHADAVALSHEQLALLEELPFGPVDFLAGEFPGAEVLERLQHGAPDLFELLALVDLGGNFEDARIVQAIGGAGNVARLFGF